MKFFEGQTPSLEFLIKHFEDNPHLADPRIPPPADTPIIHDYISLIPPARLDKLDDNVIQSFKRIREISKEHNIIFMTPRAKWTP